MRLNKPRERLCRFGFGRGVPPTFARAMVLITCCTFFFTGIMPPGTAMAQITKDQVLSLKEVPVPVPMAAVVAGPIPGPETDLNFQVLTADIVKDQGALIRLGKALFWDMQVGSDGIQSCATCHFNAGADSRSKNAVAPGIKDQNFKLGPIGGDNSFGNSTVPFTANDPNFWGVFLEPPDPDFNVPGIPEFTPNCQLTAASFPINDWCVPTLHIPRGPGVSLFDELGTVTRDSNDVISSMGVRNTKFIATRPGIAVDKGSSLPDVFNTAKPGQLDLNTRVRRVEPRNAPTIINAVYNFDNFWDGRASFIFNGVNPFGYRDQTSTLKKNINGTLTDVFVRVTNSSLASQAVGPPGSDFEMSWAGRSFPDIGKKMATIRPLAKQLVHPQDSVLGSLALATVDAQGKLSGKPGLSTATYADMVKAAFQDQWWNSIGVLKVNTATRIVQQPSHNDPRTVVLSPGKAKNLKSAVIKKELPVNQYTQMQYNWSLFFGLAVQAYEATLVSDDTPFDRFMGAPLLGLTGDPNALNDQQRLGLTIFMDDNNEFGSHCATCHVPPITTGHTVLDYQPDIQGVPDMNSGEAIQFMMMADNQEEANYDHGMYNIGVRRTTEDDGRAGTSPFINPLTNAPFPLSLVELTALRQAGKLPPDVARFVPDIPMLPRLVTKGAFKVPNLRNIKFSGPYFHNGDSATLRHVVEFYTRGGNFPNTNLHELAPDIQGIPPLEFPEFDPAARQNIEALVAFLAEGLNDQRVAREKAPFDHPQLFVPNGSPDKAPLADLMKEIPAVGKDGRTKEIPTFLNLNPQQQ